MFGIKSKQIKELELIIEDLKETNLDLFLENESLSSRCSELQAQVERLGLVRDSKGKFRSK